VLRSLRNQGRSYDGGGGWFHHVRVGMNYRWTDIQAAIGLAQLEKLDRILELREAAAARYGELLEDVGGVETPFAGDRDHKRSWFVYVVKLDADLDRAAVMDALKRASAERITAVLPYYGYARQDRKDRPRMPISARLVASLIERAGADRILALDLHAAQIQGFFDVPVDHLFALPVMIDYFSEIGGDSLTVVSPDAGGVERARAFAKRMGSPLAIIDKRRTDVNVAEVMHIIGDVAGQDCLIVDDLIDTAGTLVKACEALLEQGARSVRAKCARC